MPSPSIVKRDVRGVLRHLSRDRSSGDTPLAELALVRRSLESAGFQATLAARQHEVGRLMTELVELELAALRQTSAARAVGTIDQIKTDFSISHRDLESWSALYHVYLRPDLNISLCALERLLADRHRRTIQRRLSHGVDLLVFRLDAMERECLSASRRREHGRASSAMPEIVGAESTALQILDVLRGRRHPQVVALSGSSGIGKSALARLVATRSVEQGTVDSVLWIDAACVDTATTGGGAMMDGIALQAGLGGRADEVRRYLSGRRCLLVVDGLDGFKRAHQTIANMCALPPSTTVLVTGRVGWSVMGGVYAIEVPPLQYPHALRLLRREAAALGLVEAELVDDEALWPVVAAAGGNPLVLRCAAAQLSSADVRSVADDLLSSSGFAARMYRGLWERSYEAVAASAREVARMVVSIRASGSVADVPALMATTGQGAGAIRELLWSGVAEGLLIPLGGLHGQHYAPSLFLDRYIQGSGDHTAEVGTNVDAKQDAGAWRAA